MLMYEIWSLGKKPFHQLSPSEVHCLCIYNCMCTAKYSCSAVYVHNYLHMTESFVALFAGVT